MDRYVKLAIGPNTCRLVMHYGPVRTVLQNYIVPARPPEG